MRTKHKVAIGIIIVGAIGATVSGYLIKKQSNCNNCLDISILGINKAEETATASPESGKSSVPSPSATPEYVFQNEEYSFKITLSEAWKGYTVTQKKSNDPAAEAEFDFVLPSDSDQNMPLKIYVYKAGSWPSASKEIAPIKLTENTAYVYAYKTWDSPPADLAQITDREIADRLKTFALIK